MTETLFADRYELTELAGKGGMAEVWRAQQHGAAGFSRPVALKRILPHLASKQNFVRMFIEEARICAQLMHPNIIQIYDFGFDGGTYFLVMEWVEGLNLASFFSSYAIRGAEPPWPIVTGVAIEALKALSAAHERLDSDGAPAAVIHRDVTPPNILVGVNGIVKLSDFGLARARDGARLTDPNIIKGKMAYLAPELTRGAVASVSSDLYALGVTMWQGLAGRGLFEGQNNAEIFMAAREAQIPAVSTQRPDIPSVLGDIITKSLRFNQADRFETAFEMRMALAQLLRDDNTHTDSKWIARAVHEARQALGMPAPSQPPPPLSA